MTNIRPDVGVGSDSRADVDKRPDSLDYHRNGFKSVWFGPRYWPLFHTAAASTTPAQVLWFFEDIQHLLPCIFCRQSYKEFYHHPENPIGDYVYELPEWGGIMHNHVNKKLSKPLVDPHKAATIWQDFQNQQPEKWVDCILAVLFSIALNYPCNWQFATSGQGPQDLTPNELQRFRAYVKFYTEFQCLLPTESEFRARWVQATQELPASALSFFSRHHLVSWVHQVARLMGLWTLSLPDTIQSFECHRAQNCSPSSTTLTCT